MSDLLQDVIFSITEEYTFLSKDEIVSLSEEEKSHRELIQQKIISEFRQMALTEVTLLQRMVLKINRELNEMLSFADSQSSTKHSEPNSIECKPPDDKSDITSSASTNLNKKRNQTDWSANDNSAQIERMGLKTTTSIDPPSSKPKRKATPAHKKSNQPIYQSNNYAKQRTNEFSIPHFQYIQAEGNKQGYQQIIDKISSLQNKIVNIRKKGSKALVRK